MFNIILSLAAGILIGWNFHTFFLALNAPNILLNDINISKQTSLDSNITIPLQLKENVKDEHQKPMQSSFYSLLHNNFFSDAMALYQNASEERVLLYRSTLNNYLKKESIKDESKSIREMLEYIEIEYKNKTIKLLLIELYKKRKEFKKAIQIINELIESNTEEDHEGLHKNLLNISRSYIDALKISKRYQELQAFMETQIEYGVEVPFFIFSLAEYHIFMQSYDSAIKLLQEIEFDEQYGEKAKELLKRINKTDRENIEYPHKLPLTKEGSHFTINLIIDETPLTLLLDTGATFTMINEEKLSSLTLINDNITLKTAGGDISAQLQMAEKLTVGDIELKNFKVTTSSFKQENADGLLGMNFFEKFKFKINQEEGMLYLSEK